MTNENYFIYWNGAKVCRRFKDENGDIQLQTPNATIPLTSIVMIATYPELANNQRGKHGRNDRRSKRNRSYDDYDRDM